LCFAVWSLADRRHADVLPGISDRTAKTAIATVHGTKKKAATKKPTLPTPPQKAKTVELTTPTRPA
jgi:hypothetical protein